MENYLKQLEEAKKASAMEKQKVDAAKKEKEAKDKKYRDAMQKVDELDKEGKPREAWMKLPNLADYPEHADAIRKRSSELSAKFSPDLFAVPAQIGTIQEPVTSMQDKEALFPAYFNNVPDEQEDNHNEHDNEEETEDY